MGDSLIDFAYPVFVNGDDITFFPFRWKQITGKGLTKYFLKRFTNGIATYFQHVNTDIIESISFIEIETLYNLPISSAENLTQDNDF